MSYNFEHIEEYHNPNEGRNIINRNFSAASILISGSTSGASINTYTTGTSINENTVFFDRNDLLSAYSVDLSSIVFLKAGSSGSYSIKTFNDSTTDATGDYAMAEGYNTFAYGMGSHSEGSDSIAYSDYSHAEGQNTRTSGIASHSEGYTTTSIGIYSHTEGNNSVAYGQASHAEGESCTTYGAYSHTQGFNSIASGTGSCSTGRYTQANGDYSYVSGQQNYANGAQSSIIGGSGNTINSTATGSAILGASGITATQPYTTYVNNLNIKSRTPIDSGDTMGSAGDFTWDEKYLYVKTLSGWGAVLLSYDFSEF